MELMTTGQVAREAGVNVETIRFYERKGLLEEPPRRESGYRQYSGIAVDRIRFIKRAQELGFSLQEIQELLDLRAEGPEACPDVKMRAETKIADIEDKLHTLQGMRRALRKLIEECEHHTPADECPILEALEHPEEH
jgi:MerR family copper efflux transcriptional regulator